MKEQGGIGRYRHNTAARHIAPKENRGVASQNEGGNGNPIFSVMAHEIPQNSNSQRENHRFRKQPHEADIMATVAGEDLPHEQSPQNPLLDSKARPERRRLG
jgi:hypothetical protein